MKELTVAAGLLRLLLTEATENAFHSARRLLVGEAAPHATTMMPPAVTRGRQLGLARSQPLAAEVAEKGYRRLHML